MLTVLRVTSGNFLEMFDFFLFGIFAGPIGQAFFPVEDAAARLIFVFLTFGAGFLMRPLGAVVLGAYVDRVGRRRGLVVTLAIMAAGTILIAITPAYRDLLPYGTSVALVAPLAVLLGRLAQGFSAGVELGGVSVYLAEIAPSKRRGFFAAWQSASQQVAIIVAALIGYALTKAFDAATIAAWAWRLPFAAGCLIVPVIFVLRSRLAETEAFMKRGPPPDLKQLLATLAANWLIVGLGTMLVVMTTVSFYLITIYTPAFGSQALALRPGDVLLVTIAVGVSNFVWLPLAGGLSDRIGRKPILVGSCIWALVTAYPILAWLAASPSFERMLAAELWLSFLYATYNGAMIAALTEIVPERIRTTGFSLAYSLATALFGGFTPAACQTLIKLTADKAAPGLWMTGAAAISLAATLIVYREPIAKTGSDPA